MSADVGDGLRSPVPARVPAPRGSHDPAPALRGTTRALAAFLVVVTGLIAVSSVPPRTVAGWLAWAVLGLLAGLVAGSARRVWVAPAAVLGYLAVAAAAGLLDDLRPFWLPATVVAGGVLTAGFRFGCELSWRRLPHQVVRDLWTTSPRWRAAIAIMTVAVTLEIGGLSAYGFFIGAEDYLSGQPRETACETPQTRYGWAFEAINYDPADDAALVAANPDLRRCTSQGTSPGDAVVAPDGVRLAGWYVPAVSAVGATGPTIVIVHGGKSNKSAMLAYAAPLHADYNLVFVDLRNSGRSDRAASTGGLHERDDLRAMIDWLQRTKGPAWIAVLGNSNGAGTALAEAIDDPRVQALVLDSMHASVETQVGNVAETELGLPAWPGVWALVTSVSLRLGEDLASVDPIVSIGRLAVRPIPILLTHGLRDLVDRPADSLEPNIRAALAAGLPVEVRTCPAAGHGMVVEVCADAWAGWLTSFLSGASPTIDR